MRFPSLHPADDVLHAYLADALDARTHDRIAAHLARCTTCQDALRFMSRLRDSFDSPGAPAPSRILARAEATRATGERRILPRPLGTVQPVARTQGQRIALAIGVAAGVVLTLSVGIVVGVSASYASAAIPDAPRPSLAMLPMKAINAFRCPTVTIAAAPTQTVSAPPQAVAVVDVADTAKTTETFGGIPGLKETSDDPMLVNDAGRPQMELLEPSLARTTVAGDSVPGSTNVALSRALGQATQMQPATRSPTTPEGVDAFVLAEMARMHIPGLSLAIVRAGKVVKAKGYGFADVERREPVTPETVFKIGSVSKQFLATGIMLLVQDGKLTVDDPISKHLARTPTSWSSITLRHFLTHTSGVRREGPAWREGKVQADSVIVQSAYADTLLFPTGSKYSYCNVCYFGLADVIARVSRTPWDVFLTQRVFAPQGMTSTQTTAAASVPRFATGYDWREKSILHNARYTPSKPEAMRPSGAFRSTVLDLAKWDAALYRDDALTRVSRDAMWTPTKLANGTASGYGFGWQVGSLYGRRRVGHGGNVNGFSAEMARFVDDSVTVIVLTNKDGEDIDGIANQVASAYLLEKDEALLRDRLARGNDALDVQTRLAAVYVSHQSYAKASEVLEQIVQKRPTDRPALLALGFLGAEAGIAPDRAESALKAYLAIPPTSGRGQGSGYPLAHYRLALIYEKRKEFSKARAEIATALQLYPEYKLARDAEQRLRGR